MSTKSWLRETLENVAAKDTGKPGQVVIAPTQLDRHYREIRNVIETAIKEFLERQRDKPKRAKP